jgi:hypothetical protein
MINMNNKKGFDEPEPMDLSVGSRSRKSVDIVDYMEQEFKGLSGFVTDQLSANSSFDRVVKIPSSMDSYLNKYDGTAFKGVVSLILEVAGDKLYHDMADNFAKSVYNAGIRASRLPSSMQLDIQDNRDTRAHEALQIALNKYHEAEAYFFHDVEKYPFPDGRYSALDVSYLLEAEKLKVLAIQKDLDKLKSDNSNLHNTLSERNLRISDLSGLNASMKREYEEKLNTEIRRYTEYRHYHYGIPRPLRILKRIILKRLSHMKQRHRQ